MDMNQYLDVFIDESNQHLEAINENLLALEKEPENLDLVHEIFRSAHTLKGMSATMGFENVADLTHQMENVLDKVRNGQLNVSTSLMDVLFTCVDALEQLIDAAIKGNEASVNVEEVIAGLNRAAGGEPPIDTGSRPFETEARGVVQVLDQFALTVLTQSQEAGFNIYYIKVTLDEKCLLKAARAYMVFRQLEEEGEVIQSFPSVQELEEESFDTSFEVIYVSKQEAEALKSSILKVSEIEQVEISALSVEDLHTEQSQGQSKNEEIAAATTSSPAKHGKKQAAAIGDAHAAPRANKTIRINIDRLDKLMNLFSELVIDRGRLEQIARSLDHQELLETVEHMSRISGDLQDLILTMRMVPVEQVFNRFPKMVRSLARELGKEVDLVMLGAETELDRTVIDEIGDPLVHLLRNAIDHGLETTEERQRLGKPVQGRVELKAYHSGNHVFIEIKDDGRGIHRGKVIEKAIERGLVSEDTVQTMSDQEVHQLLFASGFSTAQKVSDISGRGVGLDVVRNKIESLGGRVTVESEEGVGTTFSIQLPLTLSIITALLVKVGAETYAIPLTSIIEAILLEQHEVRTVHGQKVIDFRGRVLPLVSLHTVFGVAEKREEDDLIPVVVVRKGEKLAGLIVDELLGQQDIVLKSMGRYLNQVFAISGATILGDGKVALIMDCNALIK
jgi:two-component system chemotaxis sensor kinase CheA